MKEITKKWIEISNRDFDIAKAVLGLKYRGHAVMMSHQAIEKILKAYLAENNIEIRKIHNLVTIGKQTELDFPEEMWEFIQELNPHYHPNRYHDISYKITFHYTQQRAKEILNNSHKVIIWVKKQMN